MIFLSKFYEKYSDQIQILPTHWPDARYSKEHSSFFREYKSLFDAAAMGIYIGGLDP